MENANQPVEQFLTFAIGGDEYAVGILRVREILEYETVTHVPKAPHWIRGVINLRGAVVPAADLAVKFGLPPSPVTPRTCIVIVESLVDGQQIVSGIIADSVSHVIDLRPADIGAPPDFGTQCSVDYLVGMGRLDRRFVLVLDIDRALAPGDALAAPAETGADESAPAPAAT